MYDTLKGIGLMTIVAAAVVYGVSIIKPEPNEEPFLEIDHAEEEITEVVEEPAIEEVEDPITEELAPITKIPTQHFETDLAECEWFNVGNGICTICVSDTGLGVGCLNVETE